MGYLLGISTIVVFSVNPECYLLNNIVAEGQSMSNYTSRKKGNFYLSSFPGEYVTHTHLLEGCGSGARHHTE